jgi:hypothetical protein
VSGTAQSIKWLATGQKEGDRLQAPPVALRPVQHMQGTKGPKREADHSVPRITDVKNACSTASTLSRLRSPVAPRCCVVMPDPGLGTQRGCDCGQSSASECVKRLHVCDKKNVKQITAHSFRSYNVTYTNTNTGLNRVKMYRITRSSKISDPKS